LELLERPAGIRLELAEVTDCDTAGIQLLLFGFKNRQGSGSGFFDVQSISRRLKKRLKEPESIWISFVKKNEKS